MTILKSTKMLNGHLFVTMVISNLIFLINLEVKGLTFSDNTKTFQATNKVLKTLYIHREVACKLSNKKIECRFNLERAPWWGGFFERMVGCVKRCLRKVLGNVWLNFHDLCTVLVKVKGT